MKSLRLSIIVAATAFGLGAGSDAAMANPAPAWIGGDAAAPRAMLSYGVYTPGDQPMLQQVQFFLWGGRHFCWYYSGWNGPGFYWCGYAWRRGHGWGGHRGWHGWDHRGHRDWNHGGGGWNHGGGNWNHGGGGWNHRDRHGDHGGWNRRGHDGDHGDGNRGNRGDGGYNRH